MSGGRTRTTQELCAALPDTSKATIYRHVALLLEGGILEVAGEQRVRGAVERGYRLHSTRSTIDRELAATMSLEDHRQAFASAMSALLADFNAYLGRRHADPFADLVGYAQVPLWLTREELAKGIAEVQSLISNLGNNRPGGGRSLYLFSPIVFPIEAPDGLPEDASQ
jgi:hypothetical protein